MKANTASRMITRVATAAALVTMMVGGLASQASAIDRDGWARKCEGTFDCTAFAGYSAADSGYYWVEQWYGVNYAPAADGHNCTRYAAYRMAQDGRITSTNFGDAQYWDTRVKAEYGNAVSVQSTPRVGSVPQIAQWETQHVAYVDDVTYSNGKYTIYISEDSFNYNYTARRVIVEGDSGWPDHFLVFLDPFDVAPTPTIVGSGVVDSRLTSAAGVWSPVPTSFSYAWYRDGSTRVSTEQDYTPTQADIGHDITVKVTGMKDGYISKTRTSDAVPITASTFAFSGAPSAISGTAKVEYTLSSSSGISTSGVTSSIKWLRNGATRQTGGNTLALTSADIGTSITVQYTYSKLGYETRTYTSPAVTVAGYSTYSFTGAPSAISGTAKVEYTLSASSGLTTSGVTSSITWWRNGVLRQSGGSTLALTSADIGASITVRYTFDKQGYQTTSYTSSAVTIAGYSSYSFSGAPAAISGTPKVGNTIQAVSGLTTSGVTMTYTWYRNGAVRQTGGSALLLTSADGGTSITFRNSLDKQGYQATSSTSTAVTVVK